MFPDILVSALIAGITAVLSGFFTYKAATRQAVVTAEQSKEQRLDDYAERLRAGLMEDIERLRDEITVLRQENEDLKHRLDSQDRFIHQLRNRVISLGGDWIGEERRQRNEPPPPSGERRTR